MIGGEIDKGQQTSCSAQEDTMDFVSMEDPNDKCIEGAKVQVDNLKPLQEQAYDDEKEHVLSTQIDVNDSSSNCQIDGEITEDDPEMEEPHVAYKDLDESIDDDTNLCNTQEEGDHCNELGENKYNYNKKVEANGIKQDKNVLFTQDFQIEVGSPAATAVEKFSEAKVSRLDKAKYLWNKSKRKVNLIVPQRILKAIQPNGNRGPTDDICLNDCDGREVGIDFLNQTKVTETIQKKRNKNVRGKVIEREHKLYTLSIAMMLGLRFSIYNTHVQMKKIKEEDKTWLTGTEFMHNEKYLFHPDGREGTPPHNLGHIFKFKDYAPVPFAYIRRMFGINEYEFIDSICANNSFIEFISNSKSGQFFFYSSDGKYMVKTMTNTESKFLRRILPHYFRHCAQNPNTLVTKFLGMYRVKLTRLHRDVKFIIMNSVFNTDNTITSFYDLKGSSAGRNAKEGESVKKDNDVRKMIANDPNAAFILLPSTRDAMRKQVINDCNFLKEMKIFDYSMLIGVHYIPSKELNPTSSTNPSSIRSKHHRKAHSTSSILKTMSKPKRERTRSSSIVEHFTRSFKEAESSNNTLRMQDFDLQFHGNEIKLVQNPHQYYAVTSSGLNTEIEDGNNPINERTLQNELIIEKSYWPFHRFYQVNGKFRESPMDEIYKNTDNDQSHSEESKNESKKESNKTKTRCTSCLSFPIDENDEFNTEEKYPLKDFESPLSPRNDGGLSMDARNTDLPIQVKTIDGGVQTCSGEIFYMGIIDVLQQFNVRKRFEAVYRQTSGQKGASCIHPYLYADRFVRFFDEYTAVPSALEEDES